MSDRMEPLTQEDGQSKDLVKQNVERLKQIFPEIVTDGKIDFETLKEELGEFREVKDERYSFTWNGKSEARKLAMEPSRGTLRPAPEESVNWGDTKHLFIEGDNLEVLKLLQRSYHKKVKMIYIDPPYNTGNDFVYSDDYRDNLSNYLKLTGQIDGEGKKVSSNPEYSGRYHTDWLNMMYPRLKLAREVLRNDGVIFISIDDHEVHNLRRICDEIFGEENFIGFVPVVMNLKGNQDAFALAETHEYCLFYTKNKDTFTPGYFPISDKKVEKNWERDKYGYYKEADNLRATGRNAPRHKRPNLFYPIYLTEDKKFYVTEDNEKKNESDKEILPINSAGDELSWYWSKGTFREKKHNLILKKTRNGYQFYRKQRPKKGDTPTKKPKSFLYKPEYSTSTATIKLKEMFGKRVFDNPKPVPFLIDLLHIANLKDNDIVLDFFAGSCSTAQAIFEQNAKDEVDRKFIMVQLPELIDESKVAYKEGYKNIAELGEERVKKAISKVKKENSDYDGDLGFKIFKLDSSNIKPWDPSFDEVQLSIEDSIENVKPDRSEEDLLYEILLKYGIDLSLPIEERTIDDSKVYIGGAGALVLCPSDNISLDVVEGIAEIMEEYNPEIMRVVFRDSGFKDDVVKTNAIQILKQHEIEDVKSI